MLIGAILGLINGLLITYVGMPPFIATYGMMWVLFGFSYLILQGAVIYGFPAAFRVIGNGNLLGIPMPIIVMAVVFICGYFVLNHTTLGRRFFATGANIETARMSGIRVDQVIIVAYVISGFLAALAGLVLIAYTNGSEAKDRGQLPAARTGGCGDGRDKPGRGAGQPVGHACGGLDHGRYS